MHYDQIKGFNNLHSRFTTCNWKKSKYILWHDGSDMENFIISCQAKFLEASGIIDVLDEKKVVGSNVENSVVEGSYY